MGRSVRCVIFDCDGTLVDSQHAIHRCMAEAMTAHGLPAPAPGAVRAVVGLNLDEAVARLLVDPVPTVVASVTEGYKQAFRAHRQRPGHDEPLYPGARRVLDALDGRGILLAVATGKSLRGLEQTLQMHGIQDLFVSLQTADRAAGKPDPEMVLNAMADAGARPDETIVVGDTTFDIEMARNAGVRAFGVSWGYHPPADLESAGAAAILARFEDLLQAVELPLAA